MQYHEHIIQGGTIIRHIQGWAKTDDVLKW